MPNPYHDETGRFCSKGEMNKAVRRLVDDGKIDDAHKLAQELIEIEKVHSAISVLKTIPEEKISNYESLINSASASAGSYSQESINKKFDNVFSSLPDDELSAIQLIITRDLDHVLSGEYAESQKAKIDFANRVKEETGQNSTNKLKEEVEKLLKDVEDVGEGHLKAIQQAVIDAGVSSGYARRYFDKLRTRLGLAPSYNDYTGHYKGQWIERPENPVEWDLTGKNLQARIKDTDVAGKLHGSIEAYVSTHKQEINRLNNAIAHHNRSSSKINPLLKEESDLLTTSYKALVKRDQILQQQKAIEHHIALRNSLKDAGYTSPTIKIAKIDGLKGDQIATDKNGKITNIWVLVGQKDGPTTPKRIVDVFHGPNQYGANLAGNHLLDADGNRYQNFIHYANFGHTETNYEVVVDPNRVPDGSTGKYAGIGFSASIDSGG